MRRPESRDKRGGLTPTSFRFHYFANINAELGSSVGIFKFSRMKKSPFIAAILCLLGTILSCSHEPETKQSEPETPTVHEWEDSTLTGDAMMMSFHVGDSLLVVREGETRATTTIPGATTFDKDNIVTIRVKSDLRTTDEKNYAVGDNQTSLNYVGNTTDAFYWKSQSETISLTAWSYGEGVDEQDKDKALDDPDGTEYKIEQNQKDNGYRELLYLPETSIPYSEGKSGINLTMRHQLARVVITLTRKAADDNSTVSSITIGDGTSLIPVSATFNKDETWKDVKKEAKTIKPKTETANSVYSAVLIPGTYASGMKFVNVTMSDGNEYTYTLDKDIELTKGNQYNFTISLGNDVATLEAVYPSGWTASGFPITSYNKDESFGVYVRDSEGNLLYSNLEMPAKTAGSTVVLDPGSYRTKLSTSYTYFIYYPWRENPGSITSNGTTAEAFFANVISGWTTDASQSTTDALRKNDLQVAMIQGDGKKTHALQATMAHKAGLARFTLATNTNVPTTITYLNNTKTSSNGSNTITASNSFNGFTPYNSSNTYLYLIRPNVSTTLNSNTGTDQWVSALTYNIAAGNVDTKEAKSRRHDWPATSSATWNYSFQNSVASLEVPCGGDYKLEVWGAQGCTFDDSSDWASDGYRTDSQNSCIGGYGAYSVGTVSLAQKEVLYIMVGQMGSGGKSDGTHYSYPNGGPGGCTDKVSYAGSGGGSTHVATTNVLPSAMSSNYSSVLLIMAGGGGSASYTPGGTKLTWGGYGGSAGGIEGHEGITITDHWDGGGGGTQTSGGIQGGNKDGMPGGDGKFGKGGSPDPVDGKISSAGGGGGLWGGGACWGSGGGGGSGYIGNARLTSKHMAGYNVSASSDTSTKTISVTNVSSTPTADYAKTGDGYARITFVSAN